MMFYSPVFIICSLKLDNKNVKRNIKYTKLEMNNQTVLYIELLLLILYLIQR